MRRITLLALLLTLLLTAAGCVHYVPREEETAMSGDIAAAVTQTNEENGTATGTNGEPDSVTVTEFLFPNEPESGHTKRY